MAHVLVTTANGHEAYFRHGDLIYSSSPETTEEEWEWSAATEGAISAAEEHASPSRVYLRHITGDMEPDWEAFRISFILPECEGMGEYQPSDLMNHHHDDDGQYGM